MKRVLAIYRAERFSPNSVDKDKAIMDAVVSLISGRGCHVRTIKEEDLPHGCEADIFITMGRLRRTINILKEKEASGASVINTPESIEACARSSADRIMRRNGIPVAPIEGGDGYWIKRGDEAAQGKDDVVFAADEAEMASKTAMMRARGITDIVVTAHVKGDLVKFYGVRGTGFFRTYYPNDDGISKFGDERINGPSQHHPYQADGLHNDAEKAAGLIGTDVYGGDCIVRRDGSYAIIDFNDWPSFSRCRKEAAEAIAEKIYERIKH